MNRIADEILQKILEYAMLSNTALYLDNFLDKAQPAKDNPNKPSTPSPFTLGDELDSDTERIVAHLTKDRPAVRPSNSVKRVFDFKACLQPSSQSHLLDWQLVTGTSKRIRRIGKVAFFSHKTFAMSSEIFDLFQKDPSQIQLSFIDKVIAIKYMTSIFLLEPSSTSPSSFLSLKRRIDLFRKLSSLGFAFGLRKEEPGDVLVRVFSSRRAAPERLIKALYSLRIPVKKMQLTLATEPADSWTMHNSNLESTIYPTMESFAAIKYGEEQEAPT